MHFLPDPHRGDSERLRHTLGQSITNLLLNIQLLDRGDIAKDMARTQAGVAVVVGAMGSGKSCYG